MKLTQLNICYDPELPDEMQNAQYAHDQCYAKTWPSDKKPMFPFTGHQIKIGELGTASFKHVTGGPHWDPYAGDEWTIKAGKLEIILSNLICAVVLIKWRDGRKFFEIRKYDQKEMPWWVRKLWDWLDYRYKWYQYNEPQVEDYPPLSYYE